MIKQRAWSQERRAKRQKKFTVQSSQFSVQSSQLFAFQFHSRLKTQDLRFFHSLPRCGTPPPTFFRRTRSSLRFDIPYCFPQADLHCVSIFLIYSRKRDLHCVSIFLIDSRKRDLHYASIFLIGYSLLFPASGIYASLRYSLLIISY